MRILRPTAFAEGVTLPTGGENDSSSRRVALLTNKWPSWDALVDLLASDLEARFRVESTQVWEIPISSGAPDHVLDEIGADSDLAIVGLAN